MKGWQLERVHGVAAWANADKHQCGYVVLVTASARWVRLQRVCVTSDPWPVTHCV